MTLMPDELSIVVRAAPEFQRNLPNAIVKFVKMCSQFWNNFKQATLQESKLRESATRSSKSALKTAIFKREKALATD